MKLALITLLLVWTAFNIVGCADKIPAVARYQASATEKCEKVHTVDTCRPLPYPSEEK